MLMPAAAARATTESAPRGMLSVIVSKKASCIGWKPTAVNASYNVTARE